MTGGLALEEHAGRHAGLVSLCTLADEARLLGIHLRSLQRELSKVPLPR